MGTSIITAGEAPNTSPGTYLNLVEVHKAFDSAPYLEAQGLSSDALLVLLCIARHASKDDQTCWPSYTTISRETLLSRSTVIRTIKGLLSCGLIIKASGGQGRSNRYRLDWGVVSQWTRTQVDLVHGDTTLVHGDTTLVHGDTLSNTYKYYKEVVQGSNTAAAGADAPEAAEPAEMRRETSPAEIRPGGQRPKGNPVDSRFRLAKPVTIWTPSSPATPSTPSSNLSARQTSPDGFPQTPAGRLAEEVWDLIGAPRRERAAAQTSWPVRLQDIAARDGGADLTSTLSAALDLPFYAGDGEYGPKLPRRTGDSLDYILAEMDTMADAVAAVRRVKATKTTTHETSQQTTCYVDSLLNYD